MRGELILGDCMDHLRGFPENHFDLAIVDPPYGRGEHGGIKRTHAVKQANGKSTFVRDGNYSKKSWDEKPPPTSYFIELSRVSKNQIIWGWNYYQYNKKASGRIVWDKVNDGSNQSDCEIALNTTNERVDIFRFMWRGMMQGSRENGAIMEGNKKLNEKRIHPTQKPVQLYRWLLTNYAKKGDFILDTHVGSASSLIACEELGFKYLGFERDKEYHRSGLKRLQESIRQVNIQYG